MVSMVTGYAARDAKGEFKKAPLVIQAPMETSAGQFDGEAYISKQQDLYDWLLAEAPAMSPDSIMTVRLTADETASIETDKNDCVDCGVRRKIKVALVKSLGLQVNFSGLEFQSIQDSAELYSGGMLQATPEGGITWTAAVESENSTALRIHLTNFSLPEDAALYVFNMFGEAFGPYTGKGINNNGDFWTNTVAGPVAYVQLRYSGAISERDLQNIRFDIAGVLHAGSRFMATMRPGEDELEDVSSPNRFCKDNVRCVEDAKCYTSSTWAPIENVRKAIAHMYFVDGGSGYICSGGLVADKNTGSQIPYFLTANHCIGTQSVASTLECYWQYWTSSCGASCYNPYYGAVPRTDGATLLKTGAAGDFTLMRLSEAPPAGSVFLGWTNQDVAYTANVQLYRISHPKGSPQAYSQHKVDTQYTNSGCWPRGEAIYSRDVIGQTEGGSSGSPVCNASGQIVGQLSGACGQWWRNCKPSAFVTVDGNFAYYYNQVSQWLNN